MMKRILLLLVGGVNVVSAVAQSKDPVMGHKYRKDAELSHWVVDFNLLGGGFQEHYTVANTSGNYLNGHNVRTGQLKFNGDGMWGLDAQLAYFFGKSKHFGLGIGFNYLVQAGNAVLDSFSAEYQSKDEKGRPVRQVVTSNGPINERVNIANMNIPVLLKYKNRLSQRWGITADLGALINLGIKNSWKSEASFDYEAIYKFSNGQWVYDDAAIPDPNDFLVTKAHFLKNNPEGDVTKYFATQAAQGNSVGLAVQPKTSSGDVSYTAGSIGLIVSPAVNYYLSDNVALSLGAYYMYQPFKNKAQAGYTLTGNIGEYNSVLNTTTSIPTQSYGARLGARVYLFNAQDRDRDGVPDKKDACPDVFGLKVFNGCPDTDGDGIPDKDDRCPTVAGKIELHGCPDKDGDGIADIDDRCPEKAGLAKFNGCPDTDGDGVPDTDDECPDVAGLVQFHGCPDTDGDGVPDKLDNCPTLPGPANNHGCPADTEKPAPPVTQKRSVPVLFNLNKTTIKSSSYPMLEEIVKAATEAPATSIVVDGYTDNKGNAAYNRKLSLKRARSVKAELVKMGVSNKRITVHGHGSKSPAVSNRTKAGRIANRRAVIHINVKD